MIRQGEILNGTYEILEPAGEGTAGIVYVGWHRNLQKKVVIKKIRDHYVGKINERREADILKKLHHRYLPQVYDFIQRGTEVYTVIDYIEGNTMTEYIRAGVRFDEAQIVTWLRQLLEALDYLHTRKPPIIHGDIKPSNIMIAENGDICLIDFNVSFGQNEERAIDGYSKWYASPEQLYRMQLYSSGGNYEDVVLDARSDLFSLGASIYNLMTGMNAAARIRNKRPLFEGESDYSEELCRIVAKALERRRKDRYQSAEAMLDDLLTIKKRDREYRKLRRGRLILTSVAAACIAAGLVMAAAGSRYRAADSYNGEVEAAMSAYDSGEYASAVRTADAALADSSAYRYIRNEYPELTKELLEIAAEGTFELEEASAEEQNYNRFGDYTESVTRFKELINFCKDAEEAEDGKNTGDVENAGNVEDSGDTAGDGDGGTSADGVGPEAAYYRDLAIAQARDEKTDDTEAEATIQEAEDRGFSDTSLLLARSEIALRDGDAGTTISAAEEVLSGNPTDEEKFRAFIVRSRGSYLKKDYEQYVRGLIDACNDPGMQNNKNYEDRLVGELEAACEKVTEEAPDKERYYGVLKEAWQKTYEEKEAAGSMTASDYMSYANSLIAGETDEEAYIRAEEVLLNAKSAHPTLEEDYRIWTELALIEAAKIGNAGEEKVRDYTQFQQYYERAAALYEAHGNEDADGEWTGDFERLQEIESDLRTAGYV